MPVGAVPDPVDHDPSVVPVAASIRDTVAAVRFDRKTVRPSGDIAIPSGTPMPDCHDPALAYPGVLTS